VNMCDTPILDFSNNQVYGATPSGLTLWYIGTQGDSPYADAKTSVIKNFLAWNYSNRGIYLYPTNNVTIDGLVIRGDAGQLFNGNNIVLGVTADDYMERNLVIQNADIQGMGTGIKLPYFMGFASNVSPGTFTLQNSYLSNRSNLDIVPPHSDDGAGLA